jgi:hypothetical protein
MVLRIPFSRAAVLYTEEEDYSDLSKMKPIQLKHSQSVLKVGMAVT